MPATYTNTQIFLAKLPESFAWFDRFTNRFPQTFQAVRSKGLFFHYWAIVAIAIFALMSNTLARRVGLVEAIAVMDPDVVVSSVQGIAPYTANLTESAEQLKISLTGGSFVGSETPATLPQEYSHTVAKGETLASIAQDYKVHVSDILSMNEIKPQDAASVTVGQALRIPAEAGEQDLTWLQIAQEARRKAEEQARLAAAARPRTALNRGGNIQVLGRQGRGGNTYPYGWCTYWVASRRYVPPRWGNARNWLNSARAAGWATGSSPAVGAIVVTTDSRFYGHVAYVEAVGGGSITISEMNYVRWGVVNRRTIPIGSGIIRGYIY